MNSLLFVYGTLRKHETCHGVLSQSACVNQQARIKGKMYDTGQGRPAAAFSEHTYICGEVYKADESVIHKLDFLKEGYHKRRVTVETDTGKKTAYAYFIKEEACASYTEIKSGDWKEYQMISRKQKPVYYFAYGSCMDNARFKTARVDHYFNHPVGGAGLPGYSTRFTLRREDGSRADLVEDGGSAEGVLYCLPFEAVSYLYKREGVDSRTYRPAFVDVEADGHLYTDCLTFLVLDKKAEIAPPEHYSREIERGAQQYLSADYAEKLKRHIESLPIQHVR